MTTSPEPWTLGPGNRIFDRLGNLVAVFRDGRDADRCLEFLGKRTSDQQVSQQSSLYRTKFTLRRHHK